MKLTATSMVTAADSARRTIGGRVVTYGEAGHTSAGPTVFAEGSIEFALDDVVLRLEHDRTRPIGRALELSATPEGLDGVFRIAGTRSGDDALVEAAEGLRAGFSVGVEVTAHDYVDGVLVVTAARLEEVSLVTHPAIASAQVATVAASEEPTDPEPATEPDGEPTPEQEENTVDESTAPAVVEATASVPQPPARVQDAFPYGPTVEASFFRDLFNSRNDVEASRRASRASAMLEAAQKSSDVAEVIPPGYRPDLYEAQINAPTPVTSAFRNLPISDATPFKVPVFGSAAGLSGNHVEGTNPTDGTINFDEVVVTPKAVSGRYNASREMLDAANPSLDAIIMSAMLEEYATDLEAYVVAQLLGAGGASAGAAITEAAATNDLIAALIAFDDARKAGADRVLVSPTLFGVLALEEDQSGRKLNPYLGPVNADGSLGSGAQSLSVVGQAVAKAWAITTVGAITAKATDATVFTSGVRTWRWEEKGGPANIEFAHFGYAACAVTRPAGVIKHAYTPTARSAK